MNKTNKVITIDNHIYILSRHGKIKENDFYTDGEGIFKAEKGNIPLQPTEDFFKIVGGTNKEVIKTLWTRNEVETLLGVFADDNALLSTKSEIDDFNKWVKTYLKK